MTRRTPSTPLSLALRAACLAAVSLALAGPARAGDATVSLADGRTLEQVTLKPDATPNELILEPGSGAPVTVTVQDLLSVDFGKVAGRPVPPTVRFANGDQVFGKVTFPAKRQVRIAAGWGSMTAPLGWCTSVRLNDKAPLPESVSQDTLFLTADRVQGEIQGVAAGKVTIDVGGRQVPVDLARVQSMGLASRQSAEGRSGLVMSIDLGGGERLTGRWVKIDPDLLTLRMDWGDTVAVPVASISRLDVKNGKLAYLSDLKPIEVKHTPYLDGAAPYRPDLSAGGRPMRLGGKSFQRGLGVHSKSDITFGLDGGYQNFVATLGLDDSVGAQGSVVYRVYGDDKLLYESPVVRGGDAPVEIKVPMKGVLLLRLVVDYADNGDVADHANWADARLLRP